MRHLFSIIALSLLLLVHASPLHATESVWDGKTIATSFYSGTGTKSDPYTIYTASQFAYFYKEMANGRTFEGQYISLKNDIDMTNVQLSEMDGVQTTYFSFHGNFNGEDHHLAVVPGSVQYSSAGPYIFGSVYGTVYNVIFSKYKTKIATVCDGGELYNCSIEKTVMAAIWTQVGGTVANCYCCDYERWQNGSKYGGAYGLCTGSGNCYNCQFTGMTYISYGNSVASNYGGNYSEYNGVSDEEHNQWVSEHNTTDRTYKPWPMTFNPTYPSYTMTFSFLDESGFTNYSNVDITSGSSYTLPTPSGFESDFLGWEVNGEIVTTVTPTDNTVCKAVWKHSFVQQPTFLNPTVLPQDKSKAKIQWYYMAAAEERLRSDITSIEVKYDNSILEFDYSATSSSGGYSTSGYSGYISIDGTTIASCHDGDKIEGHYQIVLSKGQHTIYRSHASTYSITLSCPSVPIGTVNSDKLELSNITPTNGVYYCEAMYGTEKIYSDILDTSELFYVDGIMYSVIDESKAAVLKIPADAMICNIPPTVTNNDVEYTVTEISDYAFANCASLRSIICDIPNPPQISPSAFEGVPSTIEISVPQNAINAYRAAEVWKNYTLIALARSYNIEAAPADETMGTVTGAGKYAEDAEVTLTAVPVDGYDFVMWSDGTVDNPYRFTATSNKSVTAQFQVCDLHDWTSTNKTHSSTSSHTYKINYDAGQVLSFDWSVSSESNYDWLKVSVDGTEVLKKSGSASGSYSKPFTTSGTAVLVVSYSKDSSQSSGSDEGKIYNMSLADYYLPITATSADSNQGTVTGGGSMKYGTEVSLTAIPAEGYEFEGWSDGTFENPYVFTVSGEKNVTAYFHPLSYGITVSSSDENMGSVTGTGVYEYGTEVSLTAVPAEGYEFVQWSDGTTENPYIFTVSGEKELTAFFHPLSYVISASSSDENMGSVTGAGEYEYGTNVTLNAEPAEGYEFVQWSDGTTENPYTFTATENKTLTATFQEVVEEEPNEPDTDIALYDNIIYVAPQEVRASMQSEIKIALKNSVPATGFQFEVELPEGMTVAQDSYGEDLVTLNEDRTTSKRHDIFKVTRLNSGHVQVICSSMDNKTFAAGSGNVVNMKLEVNDGVEEGDYPIIIHNIAISDADSHVERVAKAQYSVHVSTCEPGDSNGDGYVDVGDITAIVKYIQQTPPANFLFAAADANNDGFVDVGDITSVVKIIIEQANTSASSRKALIQKVLSEITDYANVIYAEPVTVNSGSESTVSLNMNNDVDVAGFQFEIKLPDGFAIAQDNYGDYQVNLSEMRTTSKRHDLFKVTKLNNGNIQIICNSMSGASFVGNEGEVVTFKLLADESIEPGEYEITLVDVRISDTDSHVDRIGNISTPLTVLGRTPEYAEGYQLEIIPFEAEIGQEYDADADEGNFFVNVKLANAEDVETLEFDVVLPEGFGIGSYLFNAGTQKKPVWVEVYDPYYAGTYTSDDYFPAAEDNEDGTIHVSSEDVVLRASSLTDIISLPITLSDDVIAGLYTIELKNVTANGDVKIAPYRLSVLVGTPALSGNQILYGNYAEDATVLNSVAAMQTVTSIDLTEAVDIAADATITTGNANALIYLAEGMEIANTENVVIGDECENLVLTDGCPFFAPKSFSAQSASYRREGVKANGWYSCVVPFDAEVPAGAKVEEYGAFNGSSISLLPIESISANVPFFFKPSESAFVLTANNTRVEATTSGVFKVDNYVGSYEKTAEKSITGKYALKADGSGFAVCGDGAYLTPFRAVLSIDNASNARVIDVDHSELTGIANVADTTRGTEIFDIQGRRVSNATKAGIYVTNGQKYIVK